MLFVVSFAPSKILVPGDLWCSISSWLTPKLHWGGGVGVKRKNGKIFYMIFAAPSRKYLLLGISLYHPEIFRNICYSITPLRSLPGGLECPRVFLKRTTESLWETENRKQKEKERRTDRKPRKSCVHAMKNESLLTLCGKINQQTRTLIFRNMSASAVTAFFMCKMLVS